MAFLESARTVLRTMTPEKPDHAAVWANCLSIIEQHVNRETFNTWFKPLQAVGLKGNVLTLLIPSRIYYEYLEQNHIGILRKALRESLDIGAGLEYRLMPREAEKNPGKGEGQQPPSAAKPEADKHPVLAKPASPSGVYGWPGIPRPQRMVSNLNEKQVFDNYVVGDFNQMAASAGMAVADKPGGTAFNPLVIYGKTGLGKTHLANAIGNRVHHETSKNVVFTTCNELLNQLYEAIRGNSVSDLMTYYQQADVFIMDDIHILENKQKMQDIFFHMFNSLHQARKQIILTSDRPPVELRGVEDRLVSRFKWGLSAELILPDLETRMAIFKTKMEANGVQVPHEVVEFICFNISEGVRELEAALNQLIAESMLMQQTINMGLAKRVVEKLVRNVTPEITPERIVRMVAEQQSCEVGDLLGKSRRRQIVQARQMAIFLIKNLTDNSLKAIGEFVGGRDHSTVLYSINSVSNLMDTDPIFKDTMKDLERKIRMSLMK